MRFRMSRHLGSLLFDRPRADRAGKALLALEKAYVPPELTPHQFALLLLHIAAEIEHTLLVTYLYAAYSLGGPRVPAAHRPKVGQWREIILGIAKEEMGHLITVQNLLRCIGGPISLDREDFPWDLEFYPFPFRLQRLDVESLARYIYVESPDLDKWKGTEADEIRKLALKGSEGEPVNRVGKLYKRLYELFEDPKALKDSAFRASTFPFQANWDEWGRGYRRGSRGASTGGAMPDTPDLLIRPVTSRTQALVAIEAVMTQGEANPSPDDDAPSHFARFLQIYRDFPKDGSWDPARKVPVNPVVTTTLSAPVKKVAALDRPAVKPTPITHPEAALWGHLFNVRYQLLLICILRTYEYPNNLSPATQVSPRGLLLNSAFGEMYNLRALAEILVDTPLAEKGEEKAGPPFQMPYTLRQPVDPEDRWRVHLDLLDASRLLGDRLLGLKPSENDGFLVALQKTDDQTRSMIEAILSGAFPGASKVIESL